MAKGDYIISEMYKGGYSSLNPQSDSYMPQGKMPSGSFGMTTDPRTANILQEVFTKTATGAKQIEIEGVNSEMFDSIPKQHMKEVNRLAKLIGVNVSLHGPVIDTAGFTQSGFSKAEREMAERKVTQTLLRSHELNPDGNITVNFHSAEGIPGSQFLAPGERDKAGTKYRKMVAVNRETGRMAPLEPDYKYFPGENLKEVKSESPEDRLKILNGSEWSNQLDQVFFNQERANELLGKNGVQIQHLFEDLERIKKEYGEIRRDLLNPAQNQALDNFKAANSYLQDVHKQVANFFSKAYEFGSDVQKSKINELNNDYIKLNEKMVKESKSDFELAQKSSEAMRWLVNKLKEPIYAPEMYVPIEKFAVEQSSQTYGNSAWEAYKKYKDKSPTLVIENPPAGFALSTGEDIKNIVEASRKKFVENATKPVEKGGGGMSENEAKKNAEKFIGATWDVGHVNMLRKFGYKEQDIIKEAEAVKPYLKHIHLSDNFGMEHTELPMGMGNVPLKEIMEKLGEKGYKATKIIEAAQWWQHFRAPPFQEVLESTGSPLYAMNMAPYWSKAPGLVQGYSSGYGQVLPQINYETFGAGFSRLPSELGGSAQGAQGNRMSGRGME